MLITKRYVITVILGKKIECNLRRAILLLFNDHRLATSWTWTNSWWYIHCKLYTNTPDCNCSAAVITMAKLNKVAFFKTLLTYLLQRRNS